MMLVNDVVKTKHMTLSNRVIMPPMATAKADVDGHVNDGILAYYEDKTDSKRFGAVIVEHSYVEKRGQAHGAQMSIDKDDDIEGMRQLVDLLKRNNAVTILQLAHAGAMANPEFSGVNPVAPSAIEHPRRQGGVIPDALSAEEIEIIQNKFIDAAVRAKKAGFDGVEIHSAHGYLLNQFLSPLTNKRTDAYGGEIENRIKLHLDIISGIKAALGEDYPVWVRMGAGDHLEGGLSTDDAVKAAVLFERAGVEVIDVSGGMSGYQLKDQSPGFLADLSKPIFDAVDIPVLLTGGVKEGKDVTDILARDVCDLVGVGRALLNESKWMLHELGDIL